jgi:hypothetical protein
MGREKWEVDGMRMMNFLRRMKSMSYEDDARNLSTYRFLGGWPLMTVGKAIA